MKLGYGDKTMKKIWNIIKLIKYAGKPGTVLLVFTIFKTMLSRIVDCGITILIPVLVVQAMENHSYYDLLIKVCIFFAVSYTGLIIFDKIDSSVMCRRKMEVSKNIVKHIFTKISNSDIGRFDDAEFYDSHVLNMNLIEEKVFDAITNVSTMISCIFILLINITLLTTTSLGTWVFVSATLIFTMIIQYAQTRFNLAYQKKAVSLNRRAEALGRFFMDYDYAKEIKVPKLSDMLFEQVLEEKQKALGLYYKCRPKFIGYSLGQLFASTFLLRVVFLVYLSYRCIVHKDFSYAGILVAYNATINLYGILNNIVAILSKYDEISLYAGNFLEIMNYENKIVSGDKLLTSFDSLEFRNVSFSYEGTQNKVLDNVSFKINKGDKIALVGRNGSGKTTLIKLLLRLYEPTAGDIFVNSVNIKEYDLESYRHFWGVVFQDSVMFNGTIKENICFDKVPACDINSVLKKVDMFEKVDKLEKRADTNYGVEIFEDGTVFSGGEQQRILVARAMAKKADMIIMDEPTSHIDPAADISFSSMIFEGLVGKTILYITHRLLSTKKADSIIVLSPDGTIKMGPHDTLMSNSELYRQLYKAQEKNYADVS